MSNIAQMRLTNDAAVPLPAHLQREQDAAIRDLVAHGHFRPVEGGAPPYDIALSIEDGRLVVRMADADGRDLRALVLALNPYRRLIQDYFLMIDSYENARRDGAHGKLEAIDMGRRGLHNEGASLFQDRLRSHIEIDHETARKFFTLICTLHKAHLRLLR